MPDKPNVIYILGDDHRAETLGVAGHPIVETPNLDQLASEGVYFRNAFCTSPACTPSRTCHYLGQWERRHGVNFNSDSAVAPSAWEQSFPAILKRNGYFLGWVGKNHVPAGEGGYAGGFLEREFDFWYGNHGHSGFYSKEGRWGGEIYRNARADTQVELFTEAVRSFLEPNDRFLSSASPELPRRPEDRPFCLCVTFNLPHGASTSTMQLRPSDDELYKSAYRDRQNEIPLPATYKPLHLEVESPKIPRSVYNGTRISQYDYVKTPNVLRERKVRTLQTVTGMDRFVGILREQLDRLGLAENTIIVFSTDHGLHHGEHGLGGKCFLFEEDLRIPMILYDPRLAGTGGRTREELVVVPDCAPTVLELAGVDCPEAMQGRSLVPFLEGKEPDWRSELFAENLFDGQNYPRSECLRTAKLKYIRYFQRTPNPAIRLEDTYGTKESYLDCLSSSLTGERPVYEELYDLVNDPGETTNLADSVGYRETIDEMRERLPAAGRELRGDEPPATVHSPGGRG